MTRIRELNVLMLALLLLGGTLMAGCFGKGGGSSSQAAVPAVQAGSLVPGSVAMAKGADGAVTVSWKTASPSMGNHVLSGTVFFDGKYPLYDQVIKETAAAPTTEHTAVVPAPGAKAAIAVTDGLQGLDDNRGLGYVVE